MLWYRVLWYKCYDTNIPTTSQYYYNPLYQQSTGLNVKMHHTETLTKSQHDYHTLYQHQARLSVWNTEIPTTCKHDFQWKSSISYTHIRLDWVYDILFLTINVTEKNFCHMWNWTHDLGTNHLAHRSLWYTTPIPIQNLNMASTSSRTNTKREL